MRAGADDYKRIAVSLNARSGHLRLIVAAVRDIAAVGVK